MNLEQSAVEEPKIPTEQPPHPEDEMLRKVMESKSTLNLSEEELAELDKKDSDDYMRGNY